MALFQQRTAWYHSVPSVTKHTSVLTEGHACLFLYIPWHGRTLANILPLKHFLVYWFGRQTSARKQMSFEVH